MEPRKTRGRRGTALLLLGLLCSLAFVGAADAGQPVIDLNRGTIDIIVYFEYDATVEDIEGWKPMFDEFSKGLYDATEGQLHIRRVTFTTNKSLSGKASVWISDQKSKTAGAYAHVNGVNNIGQHIQLHQIHKCIGVAEDQINSTDKETARRAAAVKDHEPTCNPLWRGQFGALHEAGHYLFGMRDEYIGCSVQRGIDCPDVQRDVQGPAFFCSVGQQEKACIMDGGTTVIDLKRDINGRPIIDPATGQPTILYKNRRSEFCRSFLPTDRTGTYGHTPTYSSGQSTYENKQQRDLNQDCWSRVGGSEVMLILPSGFPQVQDLVADGKPLPTYQIVNEDPAFVLAVDTSRSMQGMSAGDTASKLDLAKQGGANGVDLVRGNEKIGVVGFDQTPFIAQELRTVPDQAARNNIASVIDALAIGGTQTTTGGALTLARSMLEGGAQEFVSGKSIVLLSDGHGTTGPNPVDIANDIAGEGRLAIHTVGIGEDADTATLEKIARITGGSFFYVPRASQLPSVLPAVFANARGDTTPEVIGDTIPYTPPTDPVPSIDVEIDTFTRLATFVVGHDVGAPIEVSIVSPSGLRYFFDIAEADVCTVDTLDVDPPSTKDCGNTDVTYIRNPRQQIYTVPNPESGVWTVEVRNTVDNGTDVPVDILVTADAPELSVIADVVNSRPVCYPEPIKLQATVVAQVPVTGVSATAVVTQPGGFTETITLYDDGMAVHGDDLRGDGIYGALYAGYRSAANGGGNGPFFFEIRVINDGVGGGPVPDGNEQVLGAPMLGPVPAFSIEAEACTEVTCIPDTISTGTVTLVPGGGVQLYDYTLSQMNTATVLAFKVMAGAENVSMNTLTLAGGGTGDEASIGVVGLYVDLNQDGLPDNPSLPLATTTFGADDGVATFSAVDLVGDPVPLAIIPPGIERQFLITYGDLGGPALTTLPGAGAMVPMPRLPPLPIWEWVLATLVAAMLATRVMANRQLARPLAVGACLMIAVLMTGVIGCGTSDTSPGGGGGQVGTSAGPTSSPFGPLGLGGYNVTLDPAALGIVGATSGEDLQLEGEASNSVVVVREDA